MWDSFSSDFVVGSFHCRDFLHTLTQFSSHIISDCGTLTNHLSLWTYGLVSSRLKNRLAEFLRIGFQTDPRYGDWEGWIYMEPCQIWEAIQGFPKDERARIWNIDITKTVSNVWVWVLKKTIHDYHGNGTELNRSCKSLWDISVAASAINGCNYLRPLQRTTATRQPICTSGWNSSFAFL